MDAIDGNHNAPMSHVTVIGSYHKSHMEAHIWTDERMIYVIVVSHMAHFITWHILMRHVTHMEVSYNTKHIDAMYRNHKTSPGKSAKV